MGARGGDRRCGRRRRERRAEVRPRGPEDPWPVHDRPDEPPSGVGAGDGVRGRQRAVAPDQEARRGRRRGLGRRGSPAERQDRPDERRGQGQPRRDLGQRAAGGRRRDRPDRRRQPADARPDRADAGDARVAALQRRRLAVRDQVGRLSRRGRHPRRQGQALDPQHEGRRDVFPGASVAPDLDRCDAGDRRRRGRRSRRRGPAGLLAPPGADQPATDGIRVRGRVGCGRAAHLPGLRPAVCRRAIAPQGPARGPQADAPLDPPRDVAGPVRGPRRRRRRGVRRGRPSARPRGGRRQAPPIALRAWPADTGLAEAEDPAVAGARRRRLDARRGQRQGPRRGGRRCLRGWQAPLRRQGRVRLQRGNPETAPRRDGAAGHRRAPVRSAAAT